MRLAALQPGYLPWAGFFDLMKRSDLFIIEDCLQYTKQDWRNRNRIRTQKGFIYLTVPVKKGSVNMKINEALIAHQEPWQRRHFNLLRENYHQAPFFKEYLPFCEEVYLERKWEKLIDLDLHIILFLKEVLKIDTDVILLSQLDYSFDEDKTMSLVSLCKKVGARVFLEGQAGKNFIEQARFEREGLTIEFQHYQPRPYPQVYQPFISHLSVIDLLFNVGPEAHEYI